MDIDDQPDPLELLLDKQTLPKPIAVEIREITNATEARRKNWQAMRASFVTLQYLSWMGWWDYVASDAKVETVERAIRATNDKASMGHWLTLLRALADQDFGERGAGVLDLDMRVRVASESLPKAALFGRAWCYLSDQIASGRPPGKVVGGLAAKLAEKDQGKLSLDEFFGHVLAYRNHVSHSVEKNFPAEDDDLNTAIAGVLLPALAEVLSSPKVLETLTRYVWVTPGAPATRATDGTFQMECQAQYENPVKVTAVFREWFDKGEYLVKLTGKRRGDRLFPFNYNATPWPRDPSPSSPAAVSVQVRAKEVYERVLDLAALEGVSSAERERLDGIRALLGLNEEDVSEMHGRYLAAHSTQAHPVPPIGRPAAPTEAEVAPGRPEASEHGQTARSVPSAAPPIWEAWPVDLTDRPPLKAVQIGDAPSLPIRHYNEVLAAAVEYLGASGYHLPFDAPATSGGAVLLSRTPFKQPHKPVPGGYVNVNWNASKLCALAVELLARVAGKPISMALRFEARDDAPNLRTPQEARTKEGVLAPQSVGASSVAAMGPATRGREEEGDESALTAVPQGEQTIWYLNTGGRSWPDMRTHGLWCAGGAVRYRKCAENLKAGDTVYAYESGKGYVGLGTVVTGTAVRLDAFVTEDGQPLSQQSISPTTRLAMLKNDMVHADEAEYGRAIRWQTTFPSEEAITKAGMFASPLTACRLRDADTLAFLAERFVERAVDDAASVAGSEASLQKGEVPGKRSWDEGTYFAELETRALSPALVALHRTLFNVGRDLVASAWLKQAWGRGQQSGSFTLKSTSGSPSLLTAYSSGGVVLNVGFWSTLPPTERSELLAGAAAALHLPPGHPKISGAAQFPNIADEMLRVDPACVAIAGWLRAAVGAPPLAATAAAPQLVTPQAATPLDIAESEHTAAGQGAPALDWPEAGRVLLRQLRQRLPKQLYYAPREISSPEEIDLVENNDGELWLPADDRHGISIWFTSKYGKKVKVVVGFYSTHATKGPEYREARRQIAESCNPALGHGWTPLADSEWKALGYEALLPVTIDELGTDGVARSVTSAVIQLSTYVSRHLTSAQAQVPEAS
ncbi:MAG: hypothetical protein V4850_32295 [Myxococcota bacterium]